MKEYYIVVAENMSNPIFDREEAIELFYDLFEEYDYVRVEKYTKNGVEIISEK